MIKGIMEIIKILLGVKKVEIDFSEDEQLLIYRIYNERGASNIKELSSRMNKSDAGIIDLAEEISKKGIDIWHDKANDLLILTSFRAERSSEETLHVKDKEIRIGFISDSLLGSKFQQLTALHRAHQIAEFEGVDFMIHLGVSAGFPEKAQRDEFFKYTAQEQADYIAKHYPRSTRYRTRLISGYHDMKWRKREGKNVLVMACRQREDLIYRGDLVSDFPLRRGSEKGDKWPILRAAYRGGDNSPYSKSYPVQGFEETLTQNIADLFEEDKVDIGVVAGQGVYLALPGDTVRSLVSLPGMRMVPPSVLRKKNRAVAPTIGFVILTIRFTEDGNFFVKKSTCYPLPSTKDDYKFKFSEEKHRVAELNEDERNVLSLLEKSPRSCGELSQALDKSADTVVRVIKSLRHRGYEISDPKERKESQNYKLVSKLKEKWNVEPINFKEHFHETVEEGAVSDTHIGSVAELLPILTEAYDIFEERGLKHVNHVGDVSNGPSKHNEQKKGENYEDRATPLRNHIVRKYPERKGITTHVVGGNHDGWYADLVGLDFIAYVADGRPDFDHLGSCTGDRQVGKAFIWLRHYDWGTGYARSYKPQMVVETLLKEVSKEPARYKGKPIIILSGGGHVYCSMIIKGVVFILMPCLQGKTSFVNRMGKSGDVGFIIFSISYSKSGVLTRFSVEYFDRVAKAREVERKKVTNEKRRNSLIREHRASKKSKKKEEPKEKAPKKK